MSRVTTYTQEFKDNAVDLAINSGKVSETAKNLGIPDSTLHTWVKLSKKDNIVIMSQNNKKLNKKINIGNLLSEVQELKKKLAKSEQEKEILKKAAAYFAKEQM